LLDRLHRMAYKPQPVRRNQSRAVHGSGSECLASR
jgi:hypothetical protein